MTKEDLFCKHCPNSDKRMMEWIGTKDGDVLVFCQVCSKLSLHKESESDVRQGDSKDKLK